jgi:DNA polymerase-3 subunit delta
MSTAPRHVYLLHGEEDLLIDQAVATLLDRLVPPEERALNLDVVWPDEMGITDLITRLDTLPFFGQRRVVIVKGADAWKAPEQERFAAYLERGAPPAALIVVAQGLDRRRKLYTTIRRVGEIQEFPRLSVRQLPSWIAECAQQAHRQLDPDAMEALIALVGSGLRQLTLEMEKVFAYAGERTHITRADVEAAVSRLSESTIFMLVDAIGEQRADQAVRHLTEILRDEAPPYVLFMVARQFRLLYRASVLLAARKPPAALQESLGVPPFVVRRIIEQARNFPPAGFPTLFARLQEADRAIKTSGHARLALEMLIADLCVPRRDLLETRRPAARRS